MKIENKELVDEFYESIKEDYPHYDLEQIRNVIYGPWRYVVSLMKRGDLPEIRIKYFGVFLVNKGTAIMQLKKLKKDFEEGKINHRHYFKLKKMFEEYLKEIEEDEKEN